MGATIIIPTDLEEKIARRAAAKGLPLEEYARSVLERDADTPAFRELFAPVREQIQASGTANEELAVEIEEAVSEMRQRRCE